MNKAVLTKKLAKKLGITKTLAENFINEFTTEVRTTVAKGKRVTLVGFGSFYTRKAKARTGRNPQTGTKLSIPSKWKVKFAPGEEFRTSAN
jgi:DNA-binding protein HU-beta